MAAQGFWIAGACIYIVLAGLHLLYTFFTNKFSVRDQQTEQLMKVNYPVLTRKTTMWKAWIGFNGSHSIGGIFFGAINLFFAISHFEFIAGSVFYILLTCLTSFFYLFLGFKYWFVIPRTGILLATICFTIASVLIVVK